MVSHYSHPIDNCFDSIYHANNFCHTDSGSPFTSLHFKEPYMVTSIVIVNRILRKSKDVDIGLRLDKARVYISDRIANHTCEVMEISREDIPAEENIADNTHRISCGNRIGTMVGITTNYDPYGKNDPVLNFSELGVCVMSSFGKLYRYSTD